MSLSCYKLKQLFSIFHHHHYHHQSMQTTTTTKHTHTHTGARAHTQLSLPVVTCAHYHAICCHGWHEEEQRDHHPSGCSAGDSVLSASWFTAVVMGRQVLALPASNLLSCERSLHRASHQTYSCTLTDTLKYSTRHHAQHSDIHPSLSCLPTPKTSRNLTWS